MARDIGTDGTSRQKLHRIFEPRTVALVGVSDGNAFAQNTRGTLESDAEVFLVNPQYDEVFGRRCYPSLTAVERPIDAVFSLVRAELSVDLVEEAARLGAGGVIVVAGGFAEIGADGLVLQDRLRNAARQAGMPIIGPNGVGYIHVPRSLDLTLLNRFERRPGGVSVVAHSGAALEAVASAAWRAGGVGLNRLISAGNEPVTDVADYLEYLVADQTTRVICLILEKIRRPAEFFAAAAKARAVGKPIVVIKLARTDRTRRMAQSHTGTLTGDAWVYDQAFKQAGILRADEIDELVDRIQFLEQFPPERWSPLDGLFVFTGTGGLGALTADLAEEEGVNVPEPPELTAWIRATLPNIAVSNPLDAAAFMGAPPGTHDRVLTRYLNDPDLDMHIYLSQFAEWDTGNRSSAEDFAMKASAANQPAVVAPLAGVGGWWLQDLRTRHGIAIGNGMRGSLRGLGTMRSFMRGRSNAAVQPATGVMPITAPKAHLFAVPEGQMLGFQETMALLESVGVPIARTVFVHPGDHLDLMPFAAPYVVKLADVPHRSDIGAVRLGIPVDGLQEAVDSLRLLAANQGLPALVAIQETIQSSTEVFIGIQALTELGPVVAFGLGGIFVETLHRVSGRMAPMTRQDAEELLSEFDDVPIFQGQRGQPAWNRAELCDILVSVGELAAGGREWIDSLDINPLRLGPDGIRAVDGLCLLQPRP